MSVLLLLGSARNELVVLGSNPIFDLEHRE